VDRSLNSRFFRLYDLNTSELLFQAELYINFEQTYKAIQPKFYCFPLFKTVIGFKFSSQYDAAYFLKLVKKFSFKGNAKEVLVESKKLLGLGNRITKPQQFTQQDNAGWDPVTQTYNIKLMPDNFKNMLQKAGFKKKQLQDKETALQIFEFGLKGGMDFASIAPK